MCPALVQAGRAVDLRRVVLPIAGRIKREVLYPERRVLEPRPISLQRSPLQRECHFAGENQPGICG